MKPFLSLISWYTKKLVLVWNRNSHNAFFTYSPGLFYTSFILNCPRLLSKWMISWDQLLKRIQMTSLCILTKNTLSRAYRSRLITPQFPQCDRQNLTKTPPESDITFLLEKALLAVMFILGCQPDCIWNEPKPQNGELTCLTIFLSLN